MAPPPKFRGSGEDWLDANALHKNKSRSSEKKKANKSAQADAIPFEAANGVVVEVFPNQCRVRDLASTGPEVACFYRRAQVWGHHRGPDHTWRERAPVAVGDRVLFRRTGGPLSKDGVVEGVSSRRNRLCRPAPAREGKVIQVLASNVDVLVIVMSTRLPDFTPGFVDRLIAAALAQGIEPILVINKIDLVDLKIPEGIEFSKLWTPYYSVPGLRVIETSLKIEGRELRTAVESLEPWLRGKISVVCGKSGAGKTTLLKQLVSDATLKTGEVSDSTGKGKHTTTSAVLYDLTLANDSFTAVIDTPGVREFGLLDITPEDLVRGFPEFQSELCSGEGCLHTEDERQSCTVYERLPRHASYLRIRASILAGEG